MNILGAMAEVGREEKEACCHCGKVWYKEHHRDGVCRQCQSLGRVGPQELARRKRSMLTYLIAVIVIFLVLIVSAIFK